MPTQSQRILIPHWSLAPTDFPSLQQIYSFVVVVEERLYGVGVVSAFGWILEVNSQIDSIQVSIQQKGLVSIEGESSNDIAEVVILCVDVFNFSDFLSDPSCDNLISFSSCVGGNQVIEGEDAEWGLAYLRKKDSLLAADEYKTILGRVGYRWDEMYCSTLG